MIDTPDKVNDIPEGYKRCTICKDVFPTTKEFFTYDKHGKYGMRSECKVCRSKRRADHNIPENHKRCTSCQKIFPATTDFFVRFNRSKDGLFYQCKECNKKYRKKDVAGVSNGHSEFNEPAVTKPTVGTPDQCGSCGSARGNIIGDIDESTRERYGYLCTNCFKVVSVAKGNLTRISDVHTYLERTRLDR